MKSAARRGSPLPRRFWLTRPRGSKWKRRKLHWNRHGEAALPRTADKKRAIEDFEK